MLTANMYDESRPAYHRSRRTDPHIAEQIWAALGDAPTVVNVGAGTGSYEPPDRRVVAVEPSEWMRRNRPTGHPRAVAATAEDLPFADRSFDAAMAAFTIHHWTDLDRGLSELRRVTRGPIVIVTFDPSKFADFWLSRYAPDFIQTGVRRCPPLHRIRAALPGARSRPVEVPLDCTDGFAEAFYGRPEAFLDPVIRDNQSGWHLLGTDTVRTAMNTLQNDLTTGTWDRHDGHLRRQPTRSGALTLVTA